MINEQRQQKYYLHQHTKQKPNEQQSFNLASVPCQTQQEQYLWARDELSSDNTVFQHALKQIVQQQQLVI